MKRICVQNTERVAIQYAQCPVAVGSGGFAGQILMALAVSFDGPRSELSDAPSGPAGS